MTMLITNLNLKAGDVFPNGSVVTKVSEVTKSVSTFKRGSWRNSGYDNVVWVNCVTTNGTKDCLRLIALGSSHVVRV
jgi:hypothetical protein